MAFILESLRSQAPEKQCGRICQSRYDPRMITLYDAPRCPFCARVRIVLADKEIEHEVVRIDLDNRPDFIKELNPPSGRVPVIEEDNLVLPESSVINEYLEERVPEPALLPADPEERALARLLVFRFDDFGSPYYDLYFKRAEGAAERFHDALLALDRRLQTTPYLAGGTYSLADAAYVPWIFRAETRIGLDLARYEAIAAWTERLLERPGVAAEREVVASL
jgi:RNA polymerase-associated protein